MLPGDTVSFRKPLLSSPSAGSLLPLPSPLLPPLLVLLQLLLLLLLGTGYPHGVWQQGRTWRVAAAHPATAQQHERRLVSPAAEDDSHLADEEWFRRDEEDRCLGEALQAMCGLPQLRKYAHLHRSIRQASTAPAAPPLLVQGAVAESAAAESATPGGPSGLGAGGLLDEGGGAVPRPKYLTFVCRGDNEASCVRRNGFGDQFMGMVEAFVAALLLDRALIIDAPMFADAFDTHLVDWLPGPDVPMNITANGTKFILEKKNAVEGDVVWLDGRHYWGEIYLVGDILRQLQPLEAADNIMLQASNGLLSNMFELPDYLGTKQRLLQMGLRLPYAFGCVVRFLMHPKKEVRELVHRELQAVTRRGARSVCLHVRTDDSTAWLDSANATSHAANVTDPITSFLLDWTERHMLRCARDIAELWIPQDESHILWVFSTDYYALKLALKQRYGDKVVTTAFKPRHSNGHDRHSAANRESVAEWYLLTQCDFYVLSQSGFSKTAAGYAMKLLDRTFFFDRFDRGFLRTGRISPNKPEPQGDCNLLKRLDVGNASKWSGW